MQKLTVVTQKWNRSNSQDFHTSIKANGNPVGLGLGPVDLVDLSSCLVGQDWVFYGPGHGLNVPDKGLLIVAYNDLLDKSHIKLQT